MKSPSCSIWFTVARTDVPFMMQTIPHIIKMCNYPFSQKVLAVDTSRLSGDYICRADIGTLTQLRKCCDNLLTSGVIDKIIHIDFSKAYQEKVYVKHLGRFIRQTHDFKGAPVLGYIFLLEEAHSEYLIHLDSDMLLYQKRDYQWITEGIKLLQEFPEIVIVTPLSGPPTEDGLLHQEVPYERDARSFYQFKRFTSRKFLVDIKRFEQLLPMKVSWVENKLNSWENMVTSHLKETPYYRADLDSPLAWALHSSDTHDHTFIQNLPRIIEKIESGWYPPEQAGHYNLHLQSWL